MSTNHSLNMPPTQRSRPKKRGVDDEHRDNTFDESSSRRGRTTAPSLYLDDEVRTASRQTCEPRSERTQSGARDRTRSRSRSTPRNRASSQRRTSSKPTYDANSKLPLRSALKTPEFSSRSEVAVENRHAIVPRPVTRRTTSYKYEQRGTVSTESGRDFECSSIEYRECTVMYDRLTEVHALFSQSASALPSSASSQSSHGLFSKPGRSIASPETEAQQEHRRRIIRICEEWTRICTKASRKYCPEFWQKRSSRGVDVDVAAGLQNLKLVNVDSDAELGEHEDLLYIRQAWIDDRTVIFTQVNNDQNSRYEAERRQMIDDALFVDDFLGWVGEQQGRGKGRGKAIRSVAKKVRRVVRKGTV